MKSKLPYGIKRSDFKRFNFEELKRIFDSCHNFYLPGGLLSRMNPDEILAFLYGGMPLKEDKETIGGFLKEKERLDAIVESGISAKFIELSLQEFSQEDAMAKAMPGYAELCYLIVNEANKVGYKSPVVLALKAQPGRLARKRGELRELVVEYFIGKSEEAERFINRATWPREYSDRDMRGLERSFAYHDPNVDGMSRGLYVNAIRECLMQTNK